MVQDILCLEQFKVRQTTPCFPLTTKLLTGWKENNLILQVLIPIISDPEDREQFSATKLVVTQSQAQTATNKNGNVKIETKNKRKSVIV